MSSQVYNPKFKRKQVAPDYGLDWEYGLLRKASK